MNGKVNRFPRAGQAGMTTLGLIILVVFIGIFAFAGLRLMPVYLNYLKIVGAVNGAVDEFDGQAPTRAAIRSSISRRFDVESVAIMTARDVEITSVEGGFEVRAKYDHPAPFIGNISFLVQFDKSELIRR